MAVITSAILAVAATAYAVQQSQAAQRKGRMASEDNKNAALAVQSEQAETDKANKTNQGALAAGARQRALAISNKGKGSTFADSTGSLGQATYAQKTLTGQ